MIKHRKLRISLLLSYALFIVGIFNVRADTFVKQVNVFNGNQNFSLILNSGGTVWQRNIYSFTTDSANYVLVPATLFLQQSPDIATNNVINNYFTFVEMLSFQPYVGGRPCELVSNGFKCPVTPNTTVSGDIFVYSGGGANQFNDMGIYGVVDQNWQLYKDDNAQIANSSSQTAQNTADINNSLNDSSIDTNQTSTDTSSWSNMNASNNTITNLLTLPIQLLQAYVNGMSGSCSSFDLGSLFGTNITLPCINIGTLIGNGLWTTIDVLFSGFMIFAIAKKLIKIFNDFTNLRSNQIDELYGGGA